MTRVYDQLILGSSSHSRKTMLENAGISFKVIPPNIDERRVEEFFRNQSKASLSGEKLALFLAEKKAADVSEKHPNALVIGCDQILSLDGKVFHKPADMEEAYENLSRLSGKMHFLSSGVVLMLNGKKLWQYADFASLKMRKLTRNNISKYLARVNEQALKTVGAYAIEAEGVQLFDEIRGSHFTVMGLPLLPLLKELRRYGAVD